MGKYRIFIVMILLIFMSNTVFAERILNERPQRGYFFYECPKGYKPMGIFHKCVPIENKKQKEEIKEVKKEKEELKKEESKQQVVKQEESKETDNKTVVNYDGDTFQFPIREDIKRIPAIYNFLMHPENKEYAKNFLEWQYKYMMHLKKIGFSLRTTFNQYGNEVYPIEGYPAGELQARYNSWQAGFVIPAVWQKIRDKIGLLYFYSANCPVCKKETPAINYVVNKFKITVRGISHDGSAYKDAPFKTVYNPELYKRFGVTQVPTIVAIYKNGKEKDIYFLGTGLVPADEILSRIFELAQIKGLIKGMELNPSRRNLTGVAYGFEK